MTLRDKAKLQNIQNSMLHLYSFETNEKILFRSFHPFKKIFPRQKPVIFHIHASFHHKINIQILGAIIGYKSKTCI